MTAPFVTYQLVIEIRRDIRVVVGALGRRRLPAGRYVYTGSARRNLEARLRRHLARTKTLHWHIDYLLAHPGVRVTGVRRHRRPECAVNQAVGGEVVVPGFGASDCRARCGSHLKRVGP